MTKRTRASWPIYALGASGVGAIVAAVLVVGPAPASQSSVTRTATVAQGVVQSTVSGTGNLEPVSQLELGFKTGGTVTHIYVKQGQEVAQGQLLATLDPQSAEVTLEQAKASLQSAEANLAKEEETGGESSSSLSTGGSGSTAGAASVSTTATPTATAPAAEAHGTESTKQPAAETKTSSPSTTSTVSPATREANLASASAAVKSDRLSVQSDEQAVQDTRLFAPEDGTIASLSGQAGEVVSGSGTTRVSSSTSSSSGSGAGATAGATTGRGTSTSAASSSSTGSSSSSFAVLANLSSMELVVPLSESEISSVRQGQPATVTVEALAGRKFAAHVSEVAILSTSNSGVVSYDVTFKLDQMEGALKPGMSASAEVVVKQAEGINVPTSAITADTVTVMRAGKQVRERVTTGLAGDSSTIVLSGLKAGQTIVLPSATTGTSSRGSTGGSRLGSGGGLGGAGFGAGGGPPAFFRGGG
jgi:multidrug efflux pump subunit AcrA (membrane-fusion protein)